MEQLLSLLAISLPDDWTIPWAGIGAILLGLGSALSGIAAVMTARSKGRDEATTSIDVSRPDDGGGSGISGSSSTSTSPGGTYADRDN